MDHKFPSAVENVVNDLAILQSPYKVVVNEATL